MFNAALPALSQFKKEFKMNFTKTVTINTSADKVWQIVGTDFNDVAQWASPVLESHANPDLPEGEKGRVCQVKGVGRVVENIYHYDESQRELAFTLQGEKNPFFMKEIKNIWRVEPNGNDRANVHMTVDITLMPVFKQLLTSRLNKALSQRADGFLNELKQFAETGQPQA